MPSESKNPPSPRSIVKKIEEDHHLLSETKAYSSMRTMKVGAREGDNSPPRVVKQIEAESHLLVPTTSVTSGSYRNKEAEEKEAARVAALKMNAPVKLSERLLEPTASMINSRSALEQKALEPKPEEDPAVGDIWWTARGSSKQDILDNHVDPYEDKVQSKYLDHTTAYVSGLTTKFKKSPSSEAIAMPKPIDPDSHVLTHTSSVRNAAYYKDDEVEQEPFVNEYRLLSLQTGPKNVESRLMEPTAAVTASKWKPVKDREAEVMVKAEDSPRSDGDQERRFVQRTSERLLEPTIALEHGKYVKPSESHPRESGWKPASGSPRQSSMSSGYADEIESQVGTSMKVKEASARLLEPTAGLENARWKGSGYVPWTDKEKDVEIKLGEHLLEPTAANERGRYVKQENAVDPREAAWKQVKPKVPKDLFELNNPPPAFLNPTEKVASPSERLITPTVATENGKWRGPPDLATPAPSSGSQDGILSDEGSSKVKLSTIKPVTSTEHFLTPTSATLSGTVVKSKDKEEEKSKAAIDSKKVKEPSAHLMQPTANNQFDNWKNQPPKPAPKSEEEESVVDATKRVPLVKRVSLNEHFLKPTAATVNGSTTKRSISVSKDVSVKNLVKKFSNRNVNDAIE